MQIPIRIYNGKLYKILQKFCTKKYKILQWKIELEISLGLTQRYVDTGVADTLKDEVETWKDLRPRSARLPSI